MMMPERTSAALVDWINSFPLDSTISSLKELNDGSVLAKVLIDIDPYYFRATGLQGQEEPPQPEGHWVFRFHKLKRIHKDLTRYYTDALGHRLPNTAPNLTLIAKDGAQNETIKLVKILVAAAVQSERREEYITRIQGLNQKSQTELMLVINQMIQLDDSENTEPSLDRSTMVDDNEFRMEEEMARLVAEKENIEAEKKNLARQLERLQNAFDENQLVLDRLREQMGDDGMGGDSYGRSDAILRSQLDQYHSDVQRLEEIIADKEAIISEQQSSISALTRKVDDLSPKAEAAVKWKDDLDEAHHMIEKLRKNQNVAEKYRKKLEGMGEMERQVKNLEHQNSSLLGQLRQSEEHSKQAMGLRKLVDTYKKQVDKMEQEHGEILKDKHRIEIEYNTMKEKVSGVETQRARDMEQIQFLEEKVRELESGVMSKTVEETSGDLDSELNFTTKTKADLKLQISKLEAEIARLREGGATSADNMLLKNLLEDSQKAKDKLEHDYLQSHTEKLLLESQLASLRGGGGDLAEGSDVLLKIRQNLVDRETELTSTKKRLSEITTEFTATKRELITVKSDLSLVGKDKLEALEELKKLCSIELVELREEYDELQKKMREAELEMEQKKSLLNTVLLDKDELSLRNSQHKDILLEKERAIADLRTTIAAINGVGEGRDSELEKRVLQLQNKLEDQREKMLKSREHIKKQNIIINELKEKVESGAALDEGAREEMIAEQKRRKQEEMELLQRENKLMTSAWYDLSSRLQTNTVALLRKSEPTSWLNKQRHIINSPVKKL